MALEVQIGADNSELIKKIDESEKKVKELAQLKIDKINLGLDTKKIDSDIATAKKKLSELKSVLKDTGQSFSEITPKVANGGNALMQFSRIAQDAPFGIIGIGNNLTATAEAFGHLQKETGSAGGALKALAGSVMGSGGVLLAFSLVISGLTYMAQKGLTVGDVIDEITGKFDANRRSMQEMNAQIAKNAQAQISEVSAYVSAAKNINLSMGDRLIAVKKLQDEYPAYFGNLTKEQILNGNVAGAVKEVTKALISKAKAEAFVGKIVTLSEEQEQIQSKINNAILEESKIKGLTNKQTFEAAVLINKVLRGNLDAQEAFNSASSSKVAYTVLQAQATFMATLGVQLRNNVALQEKYTNKVNDATAASIKLQTVTTKPIKQIDFTPKVEAAFSFEPIIDTSKITTQKISDLLNEKFGLEAAKIAKIPLIIPLAPNFNKAHFDKMIGRLTEFDKKVNEIISTSISDTFTNLGTVIGESIASGANVLQAAGNSLLSSLGGLLSMMGKELIKLGTAAVLAGVVTKTFGTVTGIGAGVAAIAGGVILTAAGGAIGSKANQNISSFNGQGRSVNAGNSVSTPTSSTGGGGGSSFTGGTVVFEISGQSLIGVLSNTLDKNKRLGGSLSLG